MIGLVIKVFALSLVLSIAIKYGGAALPIPATATSALLGVWLPALLMALVLAWRWQQKAGKEET
jgi:hypothetical protein